MVQDNIATIQDKLDGSILQLEWNSITIINSTSLPSEPIVAVIPHHSLIKNNDKVTLSYPHEEIQKK